MKHSSSRLNQFPTLQWEVFPKNSSEKLGEFSQHLDTAHFPPPFAMFVEGDLIFQDLLPQGLDLPKLD